MIGIDLSEEMLAIAYEKMIENNLTFPLLHQNIKDFVLDQEADMIFSYCDVINYLKNEGEIKEAFFQVNQNLKSDGYFIFDMHSPYKVKHVFKENTFAWNDKEVSVLWLTEVNEENLSVEHDLTFFVRIDNNLYEKYNEVHHQRTYPIGKVKKMLEETGFELIDTFGDFEIDSIDEESERIFYIAKRKV